MRIKIVPVFDTFVRIYFQTFVHNKQKSVCTAYRQIAGLYFWFFYFFKEGNYRTAAVRTTSTRIGSRPSLLTARYRAGAVSRLIH